LQANISSDVSKRLIADYEPPENLQEDPPDRHTIQFFEPKCRNTKLQQEGLYTD